jgi:hypothetical protein
MSNLRGEIGEVVTSWVLMRSFMSDAARISTGDVEKDLQDRKLSTINLLIEKMEDDIIGRLAELAEEKIGRLNFFFAATKLQRFSDDAASFRRLILAKRIREKRNKDIAHKELPERFADFRHLAIRYIAILRGIVAALRLMKRIDRFVLGPSAPYLWREARKRRYIFMHPPRAGYMLIPHLNLSGEDRCRIVIEELREGQEVWSEMPTAVNGVLAKVLASKKWGVLALGNQLIPLEQYPLQVLASIATDAAESADQNSQIQESK